MHTKHVVESVRHFEDGSGTLELEPEVFPRLYYTEAPEEVTALNGREVELHESSLSVSGSTVAALACSKLTFSSRESFLDAVRRR